MKISYNSIFYNDWLKNNNKDLAEIEKSITSENYENFFKIVIKNSESLQDLILKTGINYNTDKTLEIKNKIIEMN